MSTDTARVVQTQLERMSLPVPVRSWDVKDGLDATDDPAVWVWAHIGSEQSDSDALRCLKAMVRERVREVTDGLWAYVLIREAEGTEGAA